MCTVTYQPLSVSGYVLVTNRDERPSRGAGTEPNVILLGDRRALAPRDVDAGGTWVLVHDSGAALCILNGDAPSRGPGLADPISRGQLVLRLAAWLHDPGLAARLFEEEARRGPLPHRPFKLLLLTPEGDGSRRYDWDGATLRTTLLGGPGVVVSSTFEREAVAARRARLFEEAVGAAGPPDDTHAAVEMLERLHAGHAPGDASGDAFSVCMHRDDARTVSSTTVIVDAERVTMRYRAGWPCQRPPIHEVSIPRRELTARVG